DQLADRFRLFPADIAFIDVRHQRQPVTARLAPNLHTNAHCTIARRRGCLSIGISPPRGGALASACSGVAWASLRFGSRERLDTVESETFDSAGRSCSTSRNSDPSATSDDKSARGSTARRWRTPTDQTSTPESLANASNRSRRHQS